MFGHRRERPAECRTLQLQATSLSFVITWHTPEMKHTIKDPIAAYATWRKGVLLLAPLEILLIVVVAGLLVMTFFASLTSTIGKQSIAALKAHLQSLQSRLTVPGTLDPEAERERMEVLFNKVKGSCEQPVISANKELQDLLVQTETRMQAIDVKQSRQQGAWIQWKGVTQSFYDQYFPASAN